jgi:hypothetical protein
MVGAINHGGGVDSGGAEHAPGPWKHHRYCGNEENYFVRGANDEKVCGQGSGRVNEANARLIASAPDLHRLLTKSLCTLQALVSNMEESGEGAEHVAEAIAQSNARFGLPVPNWRLRFAGSQSSNHRSSRHLRSGSPQDSGW